MIDQLYEDSIYISIGDREFCIPKDIFSNPGDSQNYFTLGYGFLFSHPSDVFPGLNRDGLLRPPSIMPPGIPNHSADAFADLLHVMKGYPLHIRNEAHRKELLQDCKYYLFKGVEQKLIPHHISYNSIRNREEILIRLEDIRQTGLTFVTDPSILNHRPNLKAGWVNYQRPFVDSKSYELILEIGDECTKINLQAMRAEFFGDTKTRIFKLFKVIADKLGLPATQPLEMVAPNCGAGDEATSIEGASVSNDQVKIAVENTSVALDGKIYQRSAAPDCLDDAAPDDTQTPPRKRRRPYPSLEETSTWTVKKGQWRLRVQTSSADGKGEIEFTLVAVKLDALSGEIARNEQRAFLSN